MFKKLFHNLRRISYCFALSVLAHLAVAYGFRLLGAYDFGAPVNPPCISVSLADAPLPAPTPVAAEEPKAASKEEKVAQTPPIPPKAKPAVQVAEASPKTVEVAKESEPEEVVDEPAPELPAPAPRPVVQLPAPAPKAAPVKVAATAGSTQGTSNLPSAKYEKLTYQISALGFPVGSAELESKNEGGMTSVGLRIKTNLAFSTVFPVDDVIETHRIDGRYITTTIRQHEGNFHSDEMFTINMLKKTVAWNDLLHSRRLNLKVPVADVLDSLSGIYHLRNRPLEVGKTETLHIYDSEMYSDVPVEIVRKEEIRLPNLTKVATIVVKPLQKTAGMFRRTGDLLIWMTDDANRVPVKIVTSVAVGKITAELLSSETTPHDQPVAPQSRVGSAATAPTPRL